MLCLIPLGLMFGNILLLACILRDYNEHIKNCRRWEEEKKELLNLTNKCRNDTMKLKEFFSKGR